MGGWIKISILLQKLFLTFNYGVSTYISRMWSNEYKIVISLDSYSKCLLSFKSLILSFRNIISIYYLMKRNLVNKNKYRLLWLWINSDYLDEYIFYFCCIGICLKYKIMNNLYYNYIFSTIIFGISSYILHLISRISKPVLYLKKQDDKDSEKMKIDCRLKA